MKKHILKLSRERVGENRNYNSQNLFIDRNERSLDFNKNFIKNLKTK